MLVCYKRIENNDAPTPITIAQPFQFYLHNVLAHFTHDARGTTMQ